jgi:Flp pilus assembly protein TadD
LLAEKAPLLVLAAAASAMTLRAQQGIVQSVDTFPLESRLANAVLSCARYLGKMVWPVDLAVFYPYRERSFASLEVGGALALLAVLTALAVARWRRGYPIVGWLWFLGSLVPVLGLVQVGIQSMADRYTYLPGIGVLIFGVWFLADAAERWRLFAAPAARAAAAVAAMGVIAALGFLTWRQTHTWRDDEALFRHAALVTDDNYWASYNLGFSLLQTGRAGEAVPWFEEAVRIEPTLEAQSNLGRSLERSGRVEEAVLAFHRAAEIAPEDIVAARDLTRVLVTNGRPRDAALLAERAAARWTEDPELHYTLGLARLFLDDPASALEPLARSIELNPAFAAAHNALGIALARTGGAAGAIEHFERALEIEPEYHEARENLAKMRVPPARASQ